MASGPITSWQIDGETVADFIFWGSKITEDGDCSHEIKRHLLLGRKVMTNLDSILKSRDIILPINRQVPLSMGILQAIILDWVAIFCYYSGIICISEVADISSSNLESTL